MRKLLDMCKPLALSFGISKSNNWWFTLINQQTTESDLEDVKAQAASVGLELRFFPQSSKQEIQDGQIVEKVSQAHFIITTPKSTSDDEMLNNFQS